MNFHNMIVTFHNTSYEITHVIKINNKNVMNFNNIFNSVLVGVLKRQVWQVSVTARAAVFGRVPVSRVLRA